MSLTSRKVAAKKGVTHQDIMKLVQNNEEALNKMGKVKYQETKISTPGGPQKSRTAILNAEQARFLEKRNRQSRD